jgi:hypothetical protein
MEDLAGGGAQPFVIIGDDEFDAPQSAIGERPQEALQFGTSSDSSQTWIHGWGIQKDCSWMT